MELRELIKEYSDSEYRPDVASGNQWVAATLTKALDDNTPVCTRWPVMHEPWFNAVITAGTHLDAKLTIPTELRSATKTLFEHAILQNNGVVRRKAIDTIVAAGWAAEVTDAVIEVLKSVPGDPWLRIRALFALGFLQHRDISVENALVDACENAWGRLQEDESTAAMATEVHAALFAIGDLFGTRDSDAKEHARSTRTKIATMLEGIAADPNSNAQVARAAAYMLTVTAQSRTVDKRKDLSQLLLEQLARHSDEVTKGLSRWTLGFRFAKSGGVRLLLEAARTDRLELPDDLDLDGLEITATGASPSSSPPPPAMSASEEAYAT
jgi:hypothetical protein